MPTTPTTSRLRPAALAALGLAGCVLLAACGSGSSKHPADGATAKPGTTAGGGPTTLTDAANRTVEVPAAPRRVVVLSETDLDTALALGVTPVALTAGRGQKGAPAYLADRAKGIPVVGAVTGPDVEKVVQVKPDLILAGQVSDQQVLAQLGRIAPTVVTFGKVQDWKKTLDLTGRALGRRNQAAAFLAAYDGEVAAVKAGLGAHTGISVSVARYAPKGTSVIQQGLFASQVLADLGFKRPGIQAQPGQGHSTPISDENLQQIDGDWLFIGSLPPGAPGTLLATLAGKPAFQQLKAVRDKHVTEIDGSKWTSLGGPLAAESVLDDVKKALTP